MAKQAYVFIAKLDGWPELRRSIAIRADQTLADLHHTLYEAFGWHDDHLYAFWLDGKFWSRNGAKYVHPFALDGWDLPGARPRPKSAEVELSRLRLAPGQRIAYLFDFGDEWRVPLTLRRIVAADDGPYPRILESVGEPPPQYPDYDAAEEAA